MVCLAGPSRRHERSGRRLRAEISHNFLMDWWDDTESGANPGHPMDHDLRIRTPPH